MSITHTLSAAGTELVVVLGERFEFVEVQDFLQQVCTELDEVEQVVLDMSAVRLIDSATLAQLVNIYRVLQGANNELTFEARGCSTMVKTVLERVQLDQLFELV